MAKLLIVPNPSSLAQMPAVGQGDPELAKLIRPKLLASRAKQLEDFVLRLLRTTSAGRAQMRRQGPADVVKHVAWMKKQGALNPLVAMGAIIIDEAYVDRYLLPQAFNCTVADDRPVGQPVGPPPRAVPAAPDLWHLGERGINAQRFRAARPLLTGAGVIVGVLDTGIAAGHPEFAYERVIYREFDGDGKPLDVGCRDASGHGTHICGLIAGKSTGVAPGVTLAVAGVITGSEGRYGTMRQIAAGLDWLIGTSFRGADAEPGVDIINASLALPGAYNHALYANLQNARQSCGTVMIAAIGDNGRPGGNNHCSPGNYDIVVGVGSHDAAAGIPAWSDWGDQVNDVALAKPDLCAPGDDIASASPDGAFETRSGTSMSSALVCGAAALLMQEDERLKHNGSLLHDYLHQLATRICDPPARAGRGGFVLPANEPLKSS